MVNERNVVSKINVVNERNVANERNVTNERRMRGYVYLTRCHIMVPLKFTRYGI